MKLEIYLRTRVDPIVVDVSEVTIIRGAISGEFRSVKWTTPGGAERCLRHLALDELTCLVEVREPGDDDEHEASQEEV